MILPGQGVILPVPTLQSHGAAQTLKCNYNRLKNVKDWYFLVLFKLLST